MKANFLSGFWPFKKKDIEELGDEFCNPKQKEIIEIDYVGITKRMTDTINNTVESRVMLIEEFFNKKVSKLEKKIEALAGKNKEVIELLTDNIEDEALELEDRFVQIDKNLDINIKMLEEKIKAVLQRNTELRKNNLEIGKKYDAILDILAEKQDDKKDPLPNLFVGDVSLREVWRKNNGNQDALLYSIAYMLKRAIEEKGGKVK